MDSPHSTASAPDVWQQLRDFRLGDPLTRLVGYVAALPGAWDAKSAPPTPAGTALARVGSAGGATPLATPAATAEGMHIFGLFASRYFLFALFVGFVITRIHVLVHRQRVRSLGMVARVGLYMPVYLLLARALVVSSMALDGVQQGRLLLWLRPVIEQVSRIAQQRWGMDAAMATTDSALWQAFAAASVFDCVDVFVARLEGSPCAPYEYIGGLIERTSLYYFYGGSVRIQELALLAVVEKLMLAHMLMALPSGWRWRLVPTGIANGLMLHHFVFSMRSHTGPQSMYPFVQVLSMALLGVSVIIVLTTASIHWLARTIDRLSAGQARRQRHGRQQHLRAAVALYDRSGVFQGPAADDDDDDDTLLEAPQGTLMPIIPDLRRDFGVEILDLAGTCLQQCSSQLQSTGLARPCGAIRVPRTTALDEYVDSVAGAPPAEDVQADRLLAGPGATSGLAVFVEDEPIATIQPPSSTARLATAIQGTRANAVRRLSLGVWAVAVALSHYARDKKTRPRAVASSSRPHEPMPGAPRPGPQHKGVRGLLPEGESSDGADESDYDYVCASSDSSDVDTESEAGCDTGEGLLRETTGLVGDALGAAAGDEQAGDRLVATVALMAHSLLDGRTGPGVMTRSMYARYLSSSSSSGLAGLLRSTADLGAQTGAPTPFAYGETEALAQLIHSRRIGGPPADDSRTLCVVCWSNARCVMLRPCRCLCLCNECRAALVVRNFDHCPCCRRTVAGYSRVYAV
ncbi:hypothetical protein LPJ61_004045 [Coemansia biformis]|uniref:RING-type domain-containing protein n=1 Tax=Coemansia biformis TaxID=1286918 RepID=A0A9W8CX51_9FUNG|nr:hypothetical protein LPJ61_004045 [Coemansia biformis]